jgi:serine/threonine protein kinase
MNCPRCDREVLENDRFCSRCGLARSADGKPIDPLIGLTVADRYRIDKRIGVGGMGTVYLGTHVRLGQNVAIKVLHERYAGDEKLTARFENEALTYGEVSHPNLVGLHDFGRTDDGTFYMVLEYCPGISLSKLIREQGALDSILAADLILQIAQGLGQAHKQAIIHRDLKPENVILTETRPGCFHARLLDFGIAKRTDDDGPRLTQAGMVFGTPEYMAPEQARGKAVDVRSDIYALGTMLYELLTGDPPFVGTDKLRVMHQQAHDIPPRPSECIPGIRIPEEIEAIVMKAIDKVPARRYQKTSDLISELDAFCRSERVCPEPLVMDGPKAKVRHRDDRLNSLVVRVSEPPTTMRNPGSRTRPNPIAFFKNPSVGAAAALFLVGVGITAWSVFGSLGHNENPERPQDPPAPIPAEQVGQVGEDSSKQRLPTVTAGKKIKKRQRQSAIKRQMDPSRKPSLQRVAQKKATAVAQEKKALALAQQKKALALAQQKKDVAARKRLTAKVIQAKQMLRVGKFEAAAVIVENAFKKSPKHPDVRTLRNQIINMRSTLQAGSLAYKSGHCAKAVTSMRRVLKVVPKYPKATAIIQNCQFASPPAQLN